MYDILCSFQCLTLPSRANKVFPYHVRTTQIGVMQVQDVMDSDTTFPFRHHQYAPSAPPRTRHNVHPLVGEWVTDVPLELFTISQSVTVDPVSVTYAIMSSLLPILLVLIKFNISLPIHSFSEGFKFTNLQKPSQHGLVNFHHKCIKEC
jgi:hypothetical protein